MKSFAVVHNIPSPYRLYLFKRLAKALEDRYYRLHVHFMAECHGGRPKEWAPGNKSLGFAHTFWCDIGPTVRGKEWHLNVGLVGHLLANSSDVLMIGGPWDSLTGALCSGLGRRTVGIAWIEGNTNTPGSLSPFALGVKRGLLRRFALCAVPGAEGSRLLRFICGDRRPRPVILPNLVDETRFRGASGISQTERDAVRDSFSVGPTDRLAIWPARHIPEKGIHQFLSHLRTETLKGWKIVIVGDGPLRASIEALIQQRGLDSAVILAPYVGYADMPALYASADLFVLASVYDNNPLSVPEAMHSGLPVLLSRRIGNYPEAFDHGRNGWSFDPASDEELTVAVEQAFSAEPEALRAMGRASKNIACQRWNSERAVGEFLSAVLPEA